MKISFLLFSAILLITSGIQAQALDCSYGQRALVDASSGLTIRQRPSLKGEVITYALHRDTVALCQRKMGNLQVENVSGHWRPVRYQNQYGYIFDGFLELQNSPDAPADSLVSSSREQSTPSASLPGQEAKSDSASETKAQTTPEPSTQKYWQGASQINLALEMHNYCGSVQDINPGLEWYGFYPSGEKSEVYKIQPVELRLLVSKRQLYEPLEYDISTEKDERSQFLLGLDRRLKLAEMKIPDHEQEFRYRGRGLLPGQIWKMGGSRNTQLEAVGTVRRAGDCPEIENYQLSISWRDHGKRKQQDLSPLLPQSDSCKLADLYWYGDLSGDDQADFILVSQKDTAQVFSLFTSDAADPQQLVSLKAQFTLPNCKAHESGTE